MKIYTMLIVLIPLFLNLSCIRTKTHYSHSNYDYITINDMTLIHLEEPSHTRENTLANAQSIERITPDIVFFEYPRESHFNSDYFNNFSPQKKPKDKIEIWKEFFVVKVPVIEAIEKIWRKGKQVYLFDIDAPQELTSTKENTPGLGNYVWNFLRELYMKETIEKISSKTKGKTAVILCHDFHWKNITFLFKNYPFDELWGHFFGKLQEPIISKDEVENSLKENYTILYTYWKKRF